MPTLFTLLRAQHRHRAPRVSSKPERPQEAPPLGVTGLLALSDVRSEHNLHATSADASSIAHRRIAVIGAGFAGLCAAYELRSMGYSVTVYEARERVGGRVHSLDDFIDGKSVEGGGELIGGNHALWQSYKEHFGLEFSDTKDYGNSPVRMKNRTLTFEEGKTLTDELDQLIELFNQQAEKIVDAYEPWINPDAKKLDNQSVAEWIDEREWDTTASKEDIAGAKTAMKEQLASDNGVAAEEQSLLGVLAMIKGGGIDRYWTDTELFRCKGGNQKLAERFLQELERKKAIVRLNTRINRIERKNGEVHLVAQEYANKKWEGVEVDAADEVILAVPPSVWDKISSDDAKVTDILTNAPRMGKNVKFLMSFGRRFWEDYSSSPTMSEDGPVDMTWETTEEDPRTKGDFAMVAFSGAQHARACEEFGDEPLTQSKYMENLRVVYPGIDQSLKKSKFMDWPEKEEWTKASYYFPRKGEIQKWGPIWKMGVDGWFHFAGEHTSYAFMGYMEGALTSGFRLARRIAVRDKRLPG